jgi:hypoxanthine-DNA glycosylase
MRSGQSPVSFLDSSQTRRTRGGWRHCKPTARISGALWDVLHQCRRTGSADSAIDPKSLVVNDFAELFANHPTIARVYFNGAKAADLFRRFAGERERLLHYQRLPSTSPAHVMPSGAKLTAWRVISPS